MTNNSFNQLYFRVGRALEEIRNTSSVRTEQVNEVDSLLHEIQIYQMELMAQMEDLQQAHEVIKETRNQYRNLFNTAPVGYLISDSNGTILKVNDVTGQLLEMAGDDIIGRSFGMYLDAESRDTYYLHRRAVLASGERRLCTVFLLNGTTSHKVQLQTSVHHQPSKTLRTAIIDVHSDDGTYQATMLTELSNLFAPDIEQDEVLKRILRAVQHVIPHDEASVTPADGDIASALTLSRQRDVRNRLTSVLDNRDASAYAAYMKQMADAQEIVMVEEMTAPAESGTAHQSYLGVPLCAGEMTAAYLHLVRRPATRFTADEQTRLREFAQVAAAAIQQAQPSDKDEQPSEAQGNQRIARALHDSVVQSLFACRMLAESAVDDAAGQSRALYQPIQDIRNLMDTALNDMQILQHELYPHMLHQLPLHELIANYVRPIQLRRSFDLALNLEDDIDVPPAVHLSLYRIAQEALNNIERHVRASRVEITLMALDDGVLLEIIDDGNGFDSSKMTVSSEAGLAQIEKYASGMDALFRVTSREDRGTCVAIFWQA